MGVARILTKFEFVRNLMGQRIAKVGFFRIEIVEIRLPKKGIPAGFNPGRETVPKVTFAVAIAGQQRQLGPGLGRIGKGRCYINTIILRIILSTFGILPKPGQAIGPVAVFGHRAGNIPTAAQMIFAKRGKDLAAGFVFWTFRHQIDQTTGPIHAKQAGG